MAETWWRWWHGARYTTETNRGYDDTECLFCPGELHLSLEEPAQVLVRLGGHAEEADLRAWKPGDPCVTWRSVPLMMKPSVLC